VRGLFDIGEIRTVSRALERAGLGVDLARHELELLGFHACVDDLEDELIRAAGVALVEDVISAGGELRSWRTFQKQPAQRAVPVERQLRRFMGTRSGRKALYAQSLVDALDVERVPRPLERVLAPV
jgi:hypothetical protein